MKELTTNNNLEFSKIFLDFLSSHKFIIIFLCIITEFLFIDLLSSIFFNNSTTDQARILKTLLQVVIATPSAIFIYTYIHWSFGEKYSLINNAEIPSYLNFVKKHLLEWVLIQIRSFARAIMYSFMLVIPGLIESVRLMFSPLHVFFNQNMKDPYYDPIIESRESIKPFSKSLLLLFLVSFMLPSSIAMSFSESNILAQPIFRISHALFLSLGIVLAQSYIFYKYINFYTPNDLTLKE